MIGPNSGARISISHRTKTTTSFANLLLHQQTNFTLGMWGCYGIIEITGRILRLSQNEGQKFWNGNSKVSRRLMGDKQNQVETLERKKLNN